MLFGGKYSQFQHKIIQNGGRLPESDEDYDLAVGDIVRIYFRDETLTIHEQPTICIYRDDSHARFWYKDKFKLPGIEQKQRILTIDLQQPDPEIVHLDILEKGNFGDIICDFHFVPGAEIGVEIFLPEIQDTLETIAIVDTVDPPIIKLRYKKPNQNDFLFLFINTEKGIPTSSELVDFTSPAIETIATSGYTDETTIPSETPVITTGDDGGPGYVEASVAENVGEFVLPDLPSLFVIPDNLDSLDSSDYFVSYTEDIQRNELLQDFISARVKTAAEAANFSEDRRDKMMIHIQALMDLKKSHGIFDARTHTYKPRILNDYRPLVEIFTNTTDYQRLTYDVGSTEIPKWILLLVGNPRIHYISAKDVITDDRVYVAQQNYIQRNFANYLQDYRILIKQYKLGQTDSTGSAFYTYRNAVTRMTNPYPIDIVKNVIPGIREWQLPADMQTVRYFDGPVNDSLVDVGSGSKIFMENQRQLAGEYVLPTGVVTLTDHFYYLPRRLNNGYYRLYDYVGETADQTSFTDYLTENVGINVNGKQIIVDEELTRYNIWKPRITNIRNDLYKIAVDDITSGIQYGLHFMARLKKETESELVFEPTDHKLRRAKREIHVPKDAVATEIIPFDQFSSGEKRSHMTIYPISRSESLTDTTQPPTMHNTHDKLRNIFNEAILPTDFYLRNLALINPLFNNIRELEKQLSRLLLRRQTISREHAQLFDKILEINNMIYEKVLTLSASKTAKIDNKYKKRVIYELVTSDKNVVTNKLVNYVPPGAAIISPTITEMIPKESIYNSGRWSTDDIREIYLDEGRILTNIDKITRNALLLNSVDNGKYFFLKYAYEYFVKQKNDLSKYVNNLSDRRKTAKERLQMAVDRLEKKKDAMLTFLKSRYRVAKIYNTRKQMQADDDKPVVKWDITLDPTPKNYFDLIRIETKGSGVLDETRIIDLARVKLRREHPDWDENVIERVIADIRDGGRTVSPGDYAIFMRGNEFELWIRNDYNYWTVHRTQEVLVDELLTSVPIVNTFASDENELIDISTIGGGHQSKKTNNVDSSNITNTGVGGPGDKLQTVLNHFYKGANQDREVNKLMAEIRDMKEDEEMSKLAANYASWNTTLQKDMKNALANIIASRLKRQRDIATRLEQLDEIRKKYTPEIELNRCTHTESLGALASIDDPVMRMTTLQRIIDSYQRPSQKTDHPHWLYCKVCNLRLVCRHRIAEAQLYIATDNAIRELNQKWRTRVEGQGEYFCKECGLEIMKLDFDGRLGADKDEQHVMENDDAVAEAETADAEAGAGILDTTADIGQEAIYEELGMSDMTLENLENMSPDQIILLHILNYFADDIMMIDLPYRDRYIIIMKTARILDADLLPYEKYRQMIAREAGGAAPPYETYRAKYQVVHVAAALVLAVQTAWPDYKIIGQNPRYPLKTAGWPFDNEAEPLESEIIRYMARAVTSIVSDAEPWKSVFFRYNPASKKMEKTSWSADNFAKMLIQKITIHMSQDYNIIVRITDKKRQLKDAETAQIYDLTPYHWPTFRPLLLLGYTSSSATKRGTNKIETITSSLYDIATHAIGSKTKDESKNEENITILTSPDQIIASLPSEFSSQIKGLGRAGLPSGSLKETMNTLGIKLAAKYVLGAADFFRDKERVIQYAGIIYDENGCCWHTSDKPQPMSDSQEIALRDLMKFTAAANMLTRDTRTKYMLRITDPAKIGDMIIENMNRRNNIVTDPATIKTNYFRLYCKSSANTRICAECGKYEDKAKYLRSRGIDFSPEYYIELMNEVKRDNHIPIDFHHEIWSTLAFIRNNAESQNNRAIFKQIIDIYVDKTINKTAYWNKIHGSIIENIGKIRTTIEHLAAQNEWADTRVEAIFGWLEQFGIKSENEDVTFEQMKELEQSRRMVITEQFQANFLRIANARGDIGGAVKAMQLSGFFSKYKLAPNHRNMIESMISQKYDIVTKYTQKKNAEGFDILRRDIEKSLRDVANIFAIIVELFGTRENTEGLISSNYILWLIEYLFTQALLHIINYDDFEKMGDQALISQKQLRLFMTELIADCIEESIRMENRINISQERLREDAEDLVEQERQAFKAMRLDTLTAEQRRIEMAKKKLKIGEWARGSMISVYKYDAERFQRDFEEREFWENKQRQAMEELQKKSSETGQPIDTSALPTNTGEITQVMMDIAKRERDERDAHAEEYDMNAIGDMDDIAID